MNIRYFLPTLVAILIPWIAFAQNSPVSSGGVGNGEGGSFSYSFGQTFYHVVGWNITFSEGVQQPYEISVYGVGGDMVDEYGGDINLSAFPNPTEGLLSLVVEGVELQGFAYYISDVLGQIVAMGTVNSIETLIDMSLQPPATYLLSVTHDGKEVKTFKIIKQ